MDEELDGLEVTACERCPKLVDSRSQIVNGTGPEDADILFVGEGPGANEDEQGEPFVGRSGSVLDDTLLVVGLERGDVRITNCVRCRPPENRDPTKSELENCRGYLEAEIDRMEPDVIVTLGKVPSEHLLGRSVSVTSAAGTVEEIRVNGTSRRVVLSVHPAATLYDRSQEDTFREALETAADLAGVDGSSSNQRRLDTF
ncbi:uracil-DNA glycosylase [Halostagnicola sp. A-GB9-2]|uniref:uracil-DNA glycosylase n=1 Tax=Halostagnicola sp. A-GB9-2 TaxID=3048066 RepID=UPI0024BFBF0A|nr:uracil-DNA glycosylase [Halostagnicola sp. A-GB9-2]MDJ1432350.1 uracil-DNA glycosylase [Halostagnicola sp. A-GB9-2]